MPCSCGFVQEGNLFSSDQALISNALPISVDFEDSEEELIPTISLLYKRIANSVNGKESALYMPVESSTFQQYFTPGNPQKFKNVYRKVIDFGALPNAGSKSVAHGITFDSNCTMTRIYGAATDPTSVDPDFTFIPLPYADPRALNFQAALSAGRTNVRVITGVNFSNFTRCTIVLEYTKNL